VKDRLEAEQGKWRLSAAHMNVDSNNVLVSLRETLISATEDANLALREAFALSLLDHCNILKMYECYFEETEAGPLFCLATERTEYSLAMEIDRRSRGNLHFTEAELFMFLDKLVCALHYAQSMHVDHRDIKPENIFFVDNEVKLGNFQNAESHQFNAESHQFLDSDATLAGSPYYLSPELKKAYLEMLRTHSFDLKFDQGKADVYSLGVTLLETALLHKPKELGKLEKVEEYTRDLDRVLGGYPGLVDWFKYMLAVKPEERASVEQLYGWLGKPQ